MNNIHNILLNTMSCLNHIFGIVGICIEKINYNVEFSFFYYILAVHFCIKAIVIINVTTMLLRYAKFPNSGNNIAGDNQNYVNMYVLDKMSIFIVMFNTFYNIRLFPVIGFILVIIGPVTGNIFLSYYFCVFQFIICICFIIFLNCTNFGQGSNEDSIYLAI